MKLTRYSLAIGFFVIATVSCFGAVPVPSETVSVPNVSVSEQSQQVLAPAVANDSLQPSVPTTGQQGASQDASSADGSEMIGQLLNMDSKQFNNLINELLRGAHEAKLKEAAERRERLLLLLPADKRQGVQDALQIYQTLGDCIKLEWCVTLLVQQVRAVTSQVMPDNKVLLDGLDKLHRSLHDGSFVELAMPAQLLGSPTDMKNILGMVMRMGQQMEGTERLFTENDLILVIHDLEALIAKLDNNQITTTDPLFKDQAFTLLTLLRYAEQKDSKRLSNECIKIIKPIIKETLAKLQTTLGVLADARIQMAPNDRLAAEAYDFWIQQIKTYTHTIKSFLDFANTSQLDFSPILTTMSYFYDVASVFFVAHGGGINAIQQLPRDGITRLSTKAFWIDASLRASMAGIALLHRRGEASNQELQKYLLGMGSLADFVDPLGQWEYKIMSIMQVVPLIANPTVFSGRMHPINRAFWRIAGSFFWYRFVVKGANDPLWSNKDAGIHIALTATIREAQQLLSLHLQKAITDNSNPVWLEKIENFSLGLIKPELIDLALEIMVPLIFLQKNTYMQNVAVFNARDFMRWDWGFYSELKKRYHPSEYAIDSNQGIKHYVHGTWEDIAQSNVEAMAAFHAWQASQTTPTPALITLDDYLNNNKGMYIEYKLIHYLCKNIGSWWGKSVAYELRKPIMRGFTSFVKKVWTGMVNLVAVDDKKDELLNGIAPESDSATLDLEGQVKLLKMVVTNIFQEQSPERMLCIGFLKNSGYLDNDAVEPLDINYRLIALVLHYCAEAGLLTHTESVKLIEDYMKYEKNIAPFIDKLFKHIYDNLAGATGGLIGGFLGDRLADILVWNGAPFFLKNI